MGQSSAFTTCTGHAVALLAAGGAVSADTAKTRKIRRAAARPPRRPGGDTAERAIKKVIANLIIFSVIAVGLYFLLPRLIGTTDAFSLITKANYWWLGAALLMEVASFMGYAFLTRFVFRVLGAELGLGLVARINLSGFAASRLFSIGGIGGFVVTYQALAKRGVSRSIAVVAVATQQFFIYIVLWLIFFASLAYLVANGRSSGGSTVVAIVIIGMILGGLVYLIYLYHHPTQLRLRARQFARLWNRLFRREVLNESGIDEWVDHIRAGIRPMTARRGTARTAGFYAVVWWVFDILCLYLTFQAFGYSIPVGQLLIAYSIAYTVGMFAPTPGGLGAVEALFLATFAGFGVPSAVAVASVLVYRLFNYWLPFPIGLVTYFTIR